MQTQLKTYVWRFGVGWNPAMAWAVGSSADEARKIIITQLKSFQPSEWDEKNRKLIKKDNDPSFMLFEGGFTSIFVNEDEYTEKKVLDQRILDALKEDPDIVLPALPIAGFSIALDG